MTEMTENLLLRGDKKFYVSDGPLVVLNEKGNPMDPQPDASSIAVSSIALIEAYLTPDRRVVLMPDDAQPAGEPWSANFSAVETGVDDDYVASGTYDVDGPGRISAGSLGTFAASNPDDELPPRA